MGFKTVYRSLLELFPQVDYRILKAVAIEHPKDADVAADVVISEVLPYFLPRSTADTPSPPSLPVYDDCKPSGLSGGTAEHEEHINILRRDRVSLGKAAGSSSESNSIDKVYICEADESADYLGDATHQEKSPISTAMASFDLNNDTGHLQGNIENEELILLVRPQHQDSAQSGIGQSSESMSSALPCEETIDHIQLCGTSETEVPASLSKCHHDHVRVGDEQTLQAVSISSTQESGVCDGGLTGYQGEWKDFDSPSPPCEETTDHIQLCNTIETELPASLGGVGDEQKLQVVSISSTQESDVCDVGLTGYQGEWKDFDGRSPDSFDTRANKSPVVPCLYSEESPQVVEPCLDGKDVDGENYVVEKTTDAAVVDFQSELYGTPSIQDIKIHLLEDFVEAAKNNKKTLFLAMESVMNRMREVELQEKAAEEAKVEASTAGLDTLTKVNELKQMLAHAKEANDMHAGEVYGEKAILATEVKELQARLLSLSDERDKALAIIDEMHQSLEERLAAAEELKKTADKQKLEQEEAARDALAEQEAIMDKVVQESKILQQEADENSKLREFLMDRGRIVDTLQGEISVICEDVRLLKERFDERIPLSKSISSNQTSCILASSGSSLKSVASDLIPEPREVSKSPKVRSLTSSIDGQSLNSIASDLVPEPREVSKSPKVRSLTSSIDGQSPKSGLLNERMNLEVASDDDWEFFE